MADMVCVWPSLVYLVSSRWLTIAVITMQLQKISRQMRHNPCSVCFYGSTTKCFIEMFSTATTPYKKLYLLYVNEL